MISVFYKELQQFRCSRFSGKCRETFGPPQFSRDNRDKSIPETKVVGETRDTRRRFSHDVLPSSIVGAFSGRVRDMLLKRRSQSLIVKHFSPHEDREREREREKGWRVISCTSRLAICHPGQGITNRTIACRDRWKIKSRNFRRGHSLCVSITVSTRPRAFENRGHGLVAFPKFSPTSSWLDKAPRKLFETRHQITF